MITRTVTGTGKERKIEISFFKGRNYTINFSFNIKGEIVEIVNYQKIAEQIDLFYTTTNEQEPSEPLHKLINLQSSPTMKIYFTLDPAIISNDFKVNKALEEWITCFMGCCIMKKSIQELTSEFPYPHNKNKAYAQAIATKLTELGSGKGIIFYGLNYSPT